jgi:uncharacterized membrane protein
MERIRSLDLARGFTVLFIPAIHAGMLYSDPSVHETYLGKCLIAIAEGPGGQLLMLLMGVSFTFHAVHPTKQVLIKFAGLLITGYLLNVLKFVIPFSLDALPHAVLQDLEIQSHKTAVIQLSIMGDILHFAAFALLVLHVFYKCKRYHWWALLAAFVIVYSSPLVWDLHTDNPVTDYLLGLATGQPPHVFFPLLPWLVYPLIGLCIGHYFRRDQQHTTMDCGLIGAALLLAGLTTEHLFPVQYAAGFYRTPPSATLWHMGIVLVTLFGWQIIHQQYGNNLFFRLLTYSSKNITTLYCIQWVMICWLLPVFGYRKLDLTYSAIAMLGITINTYLLTFTFQLIQQRYGRSKNL